MWEKTDKEDMTWENMTDYFGGLWHNQRQYSRATAKKARFNEHANNVDEEKGKEQKEAADAQMIFAMLGQCHQ